MENIILCTTKNKNTYQLNRYNPFILYKHPDSSIDDYYKRKSEYLEKHFPRLETNNPLSGRITPDAIRKKVANLQQLVFEVTDACNLKCRYCGYGDIYDGYDERNDKMIQKKQVKALFEYLLELWQGGDLESYNKNTTISFYGGEPLLNMPFIKDTVDFIKSQNLPGRRFTFSMTTNGMLLGNHIDFIAENKFSLLISLDGSCENNAYRLDFSGQNSFKRIVENKLLPIVRTIIFES